MPRFHTARVKSGKSRIEDNYSALLSIADVAQLSLPIRYLRADNRLILPQRENALAADAVLLAAMDDACLGLEPHADMRRKAKMRHQHQRAISGRHQAARSIQHLAPGRALGMPVDRFQDPALGEIGRHGHARQPAAEQLALNVAGEVPAVAGLPCPLLADQRSKGSSTVFTLLVCGLVLPSVG